MTTDFDRPTRLFTATYRHDDATWSIQFKAYNFADAEERCRKLGLTLDGEIG